MTTLTFTLPISQCLTANQRLHWAERHRRSQWLRQLGAHEWAIARSHGAEPMTKAHCTARFTWPDARRRDEHNYSPTLKALIDGAVSGVARARGWVGILPDDDGAHMGAMTLKHAGIDRTLGKRSPRVRIELEFEEVEA